MTIDWFTFTAQILNFLLLIWLLKRFLYGPIVNAMDQREARIAERLTEAAEAKDAATGRENEYREKLDDLATAREELLATAGRDVETWRVEHLRKAKVEVDGARTEWHRTLSREKQSLLRQLQLDVADHATDVSRHLLRELADERLQSQIVSRFLKLLVDSDSETHQLLTAAHHERAIQIETSHELSAPDRSRVAAAIEQITATDLEIEFRESAELICGIELRAPGCKLAWSIREFLAEVESDLIDAIDEAIPAAAATQPVTGSEKVTVS